MELKHDLLQSQGSFLFLQVSSHKAQVESSLVEVAIVEYILDLKAALQSVEGERRGRGEERGRGKKEGERKNEGERKKEGERERGRGEKRGEEGRRRKVREREMAT